MARRMQRREGSLAPDIGDQGIRIGPESVMQTISAIGVRATEKRRITKPTPPRKTYGANALGRTRCAKLKA